MKKALYLCVICVTVSVTLYLCGRGGTSRDETVTQIPSENEEDGYVLALVVKDTTNPYMQRMFAGFETACKEFKAEAVFGGPDVPSADGQIKVIEDLIAKGVSAIAVAANDAQALEDVLIDAMDHGIKVISLDSAVSVTSRILHIQQADPEVIGRVLIQAASRMIGNSGQIAVLSATPQATNQNLWIEWMISELRENPSLYRNIELAEVIYGDDVSDKSAECTHYLLDTYPDLDIIIAPTVVGMSAAGEVLEERDSKVLLTGLGLPSEMDDFIQNGICPWMYLWNPIDVGYLAAYTLQALCDGDIDGTEGQTYVAGQLGTKIITKAHDGGMEVVLANPVKFDIDNISDWKSLY